MASGMRRSGSSAVLSHWPGFWACATLVLVALAAAAPVWGPGMVNTRGGGDSPFLLQRTHQMLVNLQAGVFPARWMPDAAYGLGYPFFNYYAALPYYLAGLFALVGLDLLTAIKLVQTLGFVASALAMYGWMRRMTPSRWAAWLAAVAYTVAPYHLVNVYVRGDSLSEFYAFIFYPLILWALDGIGNLKCQSSDSKSGGAEVGAPGAGRWWWVSLAYAGLILTHNLSAAIFSPFVLLYLVAVAWRAGTGRWRTFGLGVGALGFGFLLSAWYWLPAAAETGLVQLGPSTQDFFHYSRHFRTFNLVQRGLLFDFSVTAVDTERSPFSMGLVQAACAALGGLALLIRGVRRRLATRWTCVLLGLLVATAMITPASQVLWDHLPLLPVVQFPWRFLSVQALFAAAATAALVSRPAAHGATSGAHRSSLLASRPFVPPLSAGLIGLPIAALLAASVLLPLRPERLPIAPGDVTVERLQLYELFAGNIGTTIRYEWLPQTANPRPFTSAALIEPGASGRAVPLDGAPLEATLVERKPTRQVWRVWGDGGSIAFPLHFWPGWRAQVDGELVQAWPVEGSGYLTTEIPPGEHTVSLRLGRTPVRSVAEVVSLGAAVALLLVVIRGRVRRSQPQGRKPRLLICHLSFVIPTTLAVLVLALLLLLPRGTFGGDGDLTMDFDVMPYLHHNPGGVTFEGGARLAGYRLSAEELAPGDRLAVTMDWAQTGDATTATVRLVSPAAVRYDVEPLAEEVSDLQPGGSAPVILRLPGDVPSGVYLLQLRLFGPEGEVRALTASGKTRGTLYLRPVRVIHSPSLPPDEPVLAPFGPAIRLHGAVVSPLAPDRLAVQLAWSAARPLAANYGVSLRLLDAGGQLRVSLDTQPGYGFLPTSTWRPGELVADSYVLVLPGDLPPGEGYTLEVVLYQVPTLEPVGRVRVGNFALPLEEAFQARPAPRSFDLPALRRRVGVDFGGELRLAGYDLQQGEDALRLTMWWQAVQAPQDDYTVFVHLLDPVTEALAVQSDAQPRGGAYPTSWWAAGEVVSETVSLPLGDVPPGTYRLALGLYDQTVTRLPALDADGQRLSADRVILPENVEVAP